MHEHKKVTQDTQIKEIWGIFIEDSICQVLDPTYLIASIPGETHQVFISTSPIQTTS